MAAVFGKGEDFIERRYQGEMLRVEAWTRDCIRVRATLANELKAFDWAIGPKDPAIKAEVVETDDEIVLKNGMLSLAMEKKFMGSFHAAEAPLRFFETTSGRTLLEERGPSACSPTRAT